MNGASRANNEGQNGHTIYNSGVLNAQMGEPEIKSILRDEGYSNFHDVSQKNGAYTIKSAKLYGTEVHNLVVDAQTAQVENPQPINEDQAKNLLKDKGFSNVKHVNKNGDTITAEATMNGHQEQVKIYRQTATMVNPNQQPGSNSSNKSSSSNNSKNNS